MVVTYIDEAARGSGLLGELVNEILGWVQPNASGLKQGNIGNNNISMAIVLLLCLRAEKKDKRYSVCTSNKTRKYK